MQRILRAFDWKQLDWTLRKLQRYYFQKKRKKKLTPDLQRTCRAVNKLHGKKCFIVRIEDVIKNPRYDFSRAQRSPKFKI